MTQRFEEFIEELSHFPWKNTASKLQERFREDRLGLTASSLTFTTLIALVPLFTVLLAVVTAFPSFAQVQGGLQKWLVLGFFPDTIAPHVATYLTQFASKASRLGGVGLIFFIVTAVALVFTIDKTLNNIWRVRRPRAFAQRVLIYWACLTLGPILLGMSLSITSYIITASRDVVGGLPDALRYLLDTFEVVVLGGSLACVYHYVPNVQVKWRHAWSGGMVAAIGIEVAKKFLAVYLKMAPTYAIYGTFATVPILLIWIYVAWVIVLLGAVVTAYLPSLLTGVARRVLSSGGRFQLALEMLQQLHAERDTPAKGLTLLQLAQRLQVDPLGLEPLLELLCSLDWVGQLNEVAGDAAARYVLLADPAHTLIEPMVRQLLLRREDSNEKLWQRCSLDTLTLAEIL